LALIIIEMILALVGLIVSFVGLPGGWVIFGSYLLRGLTTNFDKMPIWLVVLVFIVVLLSTFIDNVVMLLSAKKFGVTKYGIIGAIFGMIFGVIIGNIPGIIIFIILGSVLFEYIFNKDIKKAVKSGLGSAVGYGLGILIKSVIYLLLTVLFLVLLITL